MTEPLKPSPSGDASSFDTSARPFVAAVVLQLSRAEEAGGRGIGVPSMGDPARRLAAILHAAERGAEEEAVSLLENEPLLISSIFQNADLLYQHEYPAADAVSMATLTAIHRAAEAQERPGGQQD